MRRPGDELVAQALLKQRGGQQIEFAVHHHNGDPHVRVVLHAQSQRPGGTRSLTLATGL
ncbi:MAG: hypothetical protein LC721_00575 [Actinobacteria bacterium]|nr:hypothetical protein [Actinomycetota bacterium]